MITTIAPGKLMLVGEWAVLEAGKPCIALAVDKYVECTLLPSNSMYIKIPDMEELQFSFENSEVRFKRMLTTGEKEKIKFAKATICTFLRYMEELNKPAKMFKITTSGHNTTLNIDGTERKIGFGSSAACCAAIGAAFMAEYGFDINETKTKDILFKLSAIAHFIAQDYQGSGFDIAASVYGGAVYYKAFSRIWLMKELREQAGKKPLKDILAGDWPDLKIKNIKIPEWLKISCCYTSQPGFTSELIMKMDRFREKNFSAWDLLTDDIEESVESALDGMEWNNKEEIRRMIFKNQYELNELDKASQAGIMTDALKKAITIANDNGGAGKISGAGGGDCAIAVCFDNNTENNKENTNNTYLKINNAWKEAGLYPIDVKIEEKGITCTHA